MKDRDSEKLKREQAKAKLTHAVVVAADATVEEEKKCRQEAKRSWEENGKTAAWGCQWFHVWKEKVQSSGKTWTRSTKHEHVQRVWVGVTLFLCVCVASIFQIEV